MAKYRKKPELIEAITFEEFIEYGKTHGANIVNGMPWSFIYKGHPTTHETDKCYLILTSEGTNYFTPTYILVTRDDGKVHLCKRETFENAYELVDC